MPTDTKLKNLVINYLTKEQYDAIQTPNENELYLTSDMPSSGGGGVSPCLNLIDLSGDGDPTVRTSITEEEKTNLEKGLYSSVFYFDVSLGEIGVAESYFPEIISGFPDSFIFSKYNVSMHEDGTVTIPSSSIYEVTIGKKSADGTYPITIEKLIDASFGGGSGGGGSSGGAIEEIEATHEASAADYVYKLSKEPTSDMYILKLPLGVGEAAVNVRVLMMAYSNVGSSKRVFFGLASLTIFSAVCLSISSTGTEVTVDARSPLPPTITEDKDGYALVANFGAGGSARWELIPRYIHTVTLKTSAGAILWTQTLYHSKDTNVNSYDTLHSMFGGDLFAGYGEYAQLDLRGNNVASDKLIKIDGTEATLASLGTIVYSDACFLPK